MAQFIVQRPVFVGSHSLNIANMQMSELGQLNTALAKCGISVLLCRGQQQHQYPGERYFFIPGVITNIIVDIPGGIDLNSIIRELPTGGDKRHTVLLKFFKLVEAPELSASMHSFISMVELRTSADMGRGVTFPDSDYTILDVVVEGIANFAPTTIVEGDDVVIIVADSTVLALMDGPVAALQRASRQPIDFHDCAGAFS